MQLKKGPIKKLKTNNSLDTQATQSEYGQPQIKINVKSPKKLKQLNEECSLVQIIGIPQQEQTIRLSSGYEKKLIKVPLLNGKKENFLFNTQKFQAMLRSAEEENMKMMIRNTEVNQGNTSRDMNETFLHMILAQSTKQSKLKLQEKQKKPQNLQEQKTQNRKPTHKNQQKAQSELIIKKQDNKKKLRRVNSDIEIIKKKNQKYYNQCQFYDGKQINLDQIEKNYYETFIPQPSIIEKETTKLTQIKILNTENERLKHTSDSRLKLSDYIFKTQVSSTKALIQRRQRKNERLQKEVGQKKHVQAQGKKIVSKYSMTNQKLCYVLKEEIESELDQGIMYINRLKKVLNQTELKQETSNQELVRIFCMRKVIKEEVNKKLSNLVQKPTKFQGSSIKKYN